MSRHVILQRPPLQQRVPPAPHPSGPGRRNGYSEEIRELVMIVRAIDSSNHPLITHLWAEGSAGTYFLRSAQINAGLIQSTSWGTFENAGTQGTTERLFSEIMT